MSDDFNLFLLLELDPDQAWREDLFEAALKASRDKWTRGLNRPRTKDVLEAKKHLGLVPRIKAAAADAAQRAEHAQAARSMRRAQQGRKEEELARDLELFQAKGYVLESELAELAALYGPLATDMQALVKRLHVPVHAAPPSSGPAVKRLEASVLANIASALQALGKRDLYDFLELDANAHPDLLAEAANLRYAAATRAAIAGKSEAVDAASFLAGQCLSLLTNADRRASYEWSLQDARFDAMRGKLDQLSAGTRFVSASQIDLLLRDVREASTQAGAVEAAIEVIRKHAADKGFGVEIASTAVESVRQLQRCGFCSLLNDLHAERCAGCAEALSQACPRCGVASPTGLRACAACGFPSGNRFLVKELAAQAEDAVERNDPAEAFGLLQRAVRAWPGVTQGALAEQLASLQARVSSILAARSAALARLQDAVNGRRLYEARHLLLHEAALRDDDFAAVAALQRDVDAGLKAAEAALAAARANDGIDPDALAVQFQAVLRIAADCREALEGLARTPPLPARDIEALTAENLVHLSWHPSASRGVVYRVLRKEGSRPVSARDGLTLATVPGTRFDDIAPARGVPLYYGVFADREGVLSHDGATLRAPVLVLEEASDVKATAGDRRVTLGWTPPRHAQAVLVRRSDAQHPKTPEEGRAIATAGAAQAIDDAVDNERRYFYTVFSQFRGLDGAMLCTRGVQVQAVPQEPPELVRDLRITSEDDASGRRLRVHWSAPKRGTVAIYRSPASFALRAGAMLTPASLATFGNMLPADGAGAVDGDSAAGLQFYLPVTLLGDNAYAGHEVRHVSVREAEALEAQNHGHALRLQWKWPADCHEVLVAHDTAAWPQPQQAGTSCVSVSRAQYEAHGHFDIRNPAQSDHYVAICTVYGHGADRITSAGNCRLKISVRSRVDVSYEIRKPWFGKRLRLELKASGEGSLPPMVLVRKHGALPATRQDGEAIFHLPARDASTGQAVIELPDSAAAQRAYVLLFLEDDAGYDFVTIHKPAKEKLQLF